MNTLAIAVAMVLTAVTPAVADEIWDCTIIDTVSQVSPSSRITPYPRNAQIQIGDGTLSWTEHGPKGSDPTRKYSAIVNNDVGAVAIFAQATTSPAGIKIVGLPPDKARELETKINSSIPNPLVNSYSVVLNKRDGSLRVGIVGTTEVREVLTGKCQVGSTPLSANPPNPQ
jgi:hypothetical protein